MDRVDAAASVDANAGRRWGRYAVYGEISSGGMATVDYGRLIGPHGFARPVAIKRLHPQFAKDPEFVKMFVDEARMCARLHHANVIATFDVVEGPGELALVMEYVHGESLATLFELTAARRERVPVHVATTLLAGVLHGLHAAHEATSEQGLPLRIVHRDVSPQNVLVGQDGVPRLIDFGIAKAIGRLRTTPRPSSTVKGKLAYIAPEQLCGAEVDRRADVYGASAMLWEVLTGRQLFDGPNESVMVHAVLNQVVLAPSSENPDVPPALDRIVLRGLSRAAGERFASAREMALALEREVGTVTQSAVSDWLQHLAGEQLAARANALQRMQEGVARDGRSRPAGAHETRRLDIAEDGVPGSSPQSVPQEAPGRRNGRVYALWLALALSVLLAAIWGIARDGGAAISDASVEHTADPRALPEPATPAPLVKPPAALPVAAIAAPAPVAAPAAAAPTTPPPSAEPPAPRRARPATVRPTRGEPAERPAAAKSGAASKPDCVQPYVIDRRGVRHPKPECL